MHALQTAAARHAQVCWVDLTHWLVMSVVDVHEPQKVVGFVSCVLARVVMYVHAVVMVLREGLL